MKTTNEIKNMKPTFLASITIKKNNIENQGESICRKPTKMELYNSRKQIFRKH
jgi:hypothetical protein